MFKNITKCLSSVPVALLIGFLFFPFSSANAQMNGLRKGKLANGLTYYIYNDGSATVELKKEGENNALQTYDLKPGENWTHKFTNLRKYEPNGTLIKYN